MQLGLERYFRETGVNAVGLDWTVPLEMACTRLQLFVAVQGNLDPAILNVGGEALTTQSIGFSRAWWEGDSSSI